MSPSLFDTDGIRPTLPCDRYSAALECNSDEIDGKRLNTSRASNSAIQRWPSSTKASTSLLVDPSRSNKSNCRMEYKRD